MEQKLKIILAEAFEQAFAKLKDGMGYNNFDATLGFVIWKAMHFAMKYKKDFLKTMKDVWMGKPSLAPLFREADSELDRQIKIWQKQKNSSNQPVTSQFIYHFVKNTVRALEDSLLYKHGVTSASVADHVQIKEGTEAKRRSVRHVILPAEKNTEHARLTLIYYQKKAVLDFVAMKLTSAPPQKLRRFLIQNAQLQQPLNINVWAVINDYEKRGRCYQEQHQDVQPWIQYMRFKERRSYHEQLLDLNHWMNDSVLPSDLAVIEKEAPVLKQKIEDFEHGWKHDQEAFITSLPASVVNLNDRRRKNNSHKPPTR